MTATPPPLDADVCYRALTARDARFDGLFFVGVTTTGIYCRPVCPARTPGRARCQFFLSAAVAERDGFRACFRCRPELAPGRASIDAISSIVAGAVARIDEGALGEGSLDDLARDLGVTSRHLRRAVHAELGVSPIELAQSRRLALAKQLLQDTSLPVTAVALSSGFASIRRFNAAFRARFGRPPTEVRRAVTAAGDARAQGDSFTLTLGYRPPFDWGALLGFLRARAVPGVERAEDGAYVRTVRLGKHAGWVQVRADGARHVLHADVSLSLAPVLPLLVARVRRLFDLDAHPATVSAHLKDDATLAPLVAARPGLRVPGAFDGFEVGVRAILGQQVSVSAATTFAGRLVGVLGEPLATPHAGIDRTFPSAERVARATDRDLAPVGLTRARAATLVAFARAVVQGDVRVDGKGDPAQAMAALVRVPGIGPWTAAYVGMRALGAPDAFPDGDLALRRALGRRVGAVDAGPVPAREAVALAERWRPWRAYAALHLWTSLTEGDPS